MDPQITWGLFALGGALLGGLITLAATRIDRRWDRAKRQIVQLSDQVAAFYQLEQLYKDELANLSTNGEAATTIMKKMRSRVSESGEYERPAMTSLEASKIKREWV